MKISITKLSLLLIFLSIGFISCEDDSEKDNDSLYVKFENSSESEYTITGIQLLLMGKAGNQDDPVGEFGDNILKDGKVIEPGGYEFFTLEIPNLQYAYYRLTVDDGAGNKILLHDQTGYENSFDGTITHWGGDDRTVKVAVKWNTMEDYIYIQSWSDWVGID